jgi:hypothetical protein
MEMINDKLPLKEASINMIRRVRSSFLFARTAENMTGPLDADKRAVDSVVRRVLLL